MEQKERFELFGKHCIKDNSPDARPQLLDTYVACVILNDQDKKIKELEEENLSLQEQSIRDNQNWVEEVEQLKKSQKQLAISELEKVEEILWDSQDIGNVIDNDKFLEKLNYLIKSLKGAEKNE